MLAHSGAILVPKEAQKGPLEAHEVLGGPLRSWEGPKWPDLVPTVTCWSNWVGHIYIMCSGLLRDLFGTPGTPKRGLIWPQKALLGAPKVLGGPQVA